eukprot:2685862-Pleurochrysis_carterae.AAC.1
MSGGVGSCSFGSAVARIALQWSLRCAPSNIACALQPPPPRPAHPAQPTASKGWWNSRFSPPE